MSRKRKRKTEEARQTSILRKIAETDEISDEDILELFHINSLPCQGCCVKNRASPNCFCQFIVSFGTLLESTSVLQEKSDIEATPGGDSQEQLRSSTAIPSGLRNLGATCYANSILQCLYRIKPFMQGVFAVGSELLISDDVLRNLQLLFGELCSGRKKTADPTPLLEALELKATIQQDAQEFLNLFLSVLRKRLSKNDNAVKTNIVRDVFRGTLSHTSK